MASKPEIQFYHLMATPLDKALPKLMERAFSGKIHTVVYGNEADIVRLDTLLWQYDAKVLLPHGIRGDAFAEKQPIYLTFMPENPNNASLLVIVNGTLVWDIYGEQSHLFSRVFDVFDGADDAQVAAARVRWKHYADDGFALRYVQQNDGGGWDIKKEVAAK
jgi:DNA polymerase III subunit chi